MKVDMDEIVLVDVSPTRTDVHQSDVDKKAMVKHKADSRTAGSHIDRDTGRQTETHPMKEAC